MATDHLKQLLILLLILWFIWYFFITPEKSDIKKPFIKQDSQLYRVK
ncbi:MAG: hypothetical protein V4504_01630 [Patescibacteria group bacterium]